MSFDFIFRTPGCLSAFQPPDALGDSLLLSAGSCSVNLTLDSARDQHQHGKIIYPSLQENEKSLHRSCRSDEDDEEEVGRRKNPGLTDAATAGIVIIDSSSGQHQRWCRS